MSQRINKSATYFLCFLLLLLFGSVNKSDAAEKELSGSMVETESFEQIDLSFALANLVENDNWLRRLLGIKPRTVAERKSRSQRHSKTRPQRYRPPASNSQNPQPMGRPGGVGRSSDMSAVRNTPKPPLQRSRRNTHQSLGIWELGFTFSTSHAITDISGNKNLPIGDFADYHMSNFSYGAGIYGRYLMNDWFAMNLGMNFANLTAARTDGVDYQDRQIYSFNNDIFEFFAKSEFRLPALAPSPFDLYGFVGFGLFFSDASLYDQNERLVTITQDYSQVQPFIPFGGGFSVKLTNTLKLGYEFGWRNTIFPYLDGITVDNNYDHYFFNSLKIGFIF